MSCNHCSQKFNFFHKELGCTNCGLSLCSNCLKQKSQIPSKGEGFYRVCRTCYAKLSNGDNGETNKPIVPPDRFLKRLENLENPTKPPITVYKQDPQMNALAGLSPGDKLLVDRLEKLKEKPDRIPTENEIGERLAQLKEDRFGLAVAESSKTTFTQDTRSDQEKIDSLLEQYSNLQQIDNSHQSHDDIGQRLAKLKGQQYRDTEIPEENSDDSEEEVKQITKKIFSQVALEERCPIQPSSSQEEDEFRSSPELPWCVLCNEDAKFKCYDCGGDLYCKSCNREVHREWGERDHNVVTYKPKEP